MHISVIICTIRRDELIQGLLDDLAGQTFRDLEIVIVGKESSPIERTTWRGLRLVRVPAPKGLAQARNVGLREAHGDLVCFFDDDVTIEHEFFEKVNALFAGESFAEVGGLTGYDHHGYSAPIPRRWRLRRLLGLSKTLEPGYSDHMGRSVPLSFFAPFNGCREVNWLPGFCQIFRREAIDGLRYDEQAVVEDRDFSMDVGARGWKLMVSGDLALEHRPDSEARHSMSWQTRRAAFGLGRSFAKRKRSLGDWGLILRTLVGELLIDLIILARRPSWENLKTAFLRIDGYVAGLASYRRPSRSAVL